MELLLPPVPVILRAELLGGSTSTGVCIFLAGLYVGLGALGMAAATCASSERPLKSGLIRDPFCIVRGPEGLDPIEELDLTGVSASKEVLLL